MPGVRETTSGVVDTNPSGVVRTLPVVDSFERSSLSHYSGNTADYSITSNFATDGSNGLEMTGTTSASEIQSTSGLSDYPSKPVEIRIDMETSTGSSTSNNYDTAVQFSVQDSNNLYMVQVEVDGPQLRIYEKESGSYSTIDGGATTLSEWNANETYTLKIQWDDGSTFGGSNGDITAEALDSDGTSNGTNSANDTTLNSSGIGFRSNVPNTGDVNNWDYYRITG